MFSLEIKVEGFPFIDCDGKKSYCKGKVIKWAVEVGCFSLEMLLSSLSNKVNWGMEKAVALWYFDKRMGEDVRLTNETQMVDLFEMYKSANCCQVVAVILDKTVQLQHEFDELEPICMLPPDDVMPAGSKLNEPHESDAPMPPEAQICSQSASKAGEEADASEPDIFDNEEEYVGVNDEHLYIAIPPAQPSQPANNVEPNINSADLGVAAKGVFPPEAEVNDADPEEVNVVNDPLNPKVHEGALFADIVTFRKAIRHYAIQRGFELSDVRTDKTRFIAKCAHKGCPWRIHASRIHDLRTIQVR